MNKLLFAVVISAAAASAPAMATSAPIGGVLGGTLGTGVAVLSKLGPSLDAIIKGLPVTIDGTLLVVKDVVGAVPGLLAGAPIPAKTAAILVPLPGLKILDTAVVIPKILGIDAHVGGPPGVLVTVTTGGGAK